MPSLQARHCKHSTVESLTVMCGVCLHCVQFVFSDGVTSTTGTIGSSCSSQVTWSDTGSGKIVGAVWKAGDFLDAVGFYFINVSAGNQCRDLIPTSVIIGLLAS